MSSSLDATFTKQLEKYLKVNDLILVSRSEWGKLEAVKAIFSGSGKIKKEK